MTRPIFIVGSGRSGTAALARLLSGVPDVEMHHEYLCTHIQPVAARYYMGLSDAGAVRACVASCHGAAIALSRSSVWGDSSNKLSWIMPVLAEMFPDARFAHVVRDGRKVASSYFHKLADECYDDASVAALAAYRTGAPDAPMPPPEKRYWWPLPTAGHPLCDAFDGFDQFQRIAFHWAEINRVIMDHGAAMPVGAVARFRLEDLVADATALRDFFAFLDLPYRADYGQALRRPHNVNRPRDRLLDADQNDRFTAIAGPTMRALGYDARPEYVMDYAGGQAAL